MEEQDQTMEEPRYPTRIRKPLGDWWKNHILPPQHEEQANLASFGGPPIFGEALQRCKQVGVGHTSGVQSHEPNARKRPLG